MITVFKRTCRSSLTDDELMLFDALFDVWDTLESLSPENFSVSHNLPYMHGLDAAAVKGTTERLIQRGLVQCRTKHGSRGDITWLALTTAGGSLWTVEREPLWDQYCTDASWPSETGDGLWTLSVRSPRLETARAFLNTARGCGLYDVSLDQVITTESAEEPIPWHTFDAMYELRVPVSSPASKPVDWVRYGRERTWWRNIPELLRPHP